jgi:hypothetical protein
MGMNIALPTRIAFAILSAIGVGVLVNYANDSGVGGWLTVYGLSGLLFAAGVLFPYLNPGDKKLLRATGLVIASVISFRSAVWVALESPLPGEDWALFTAASLTGAAIVMVAIVLIVPIRSSIAFSLLGLFASIVGGPITSATLPEDGVLMFVGYVSWHTLICLAIYFGTPSTVAGAKFSARFARSRSAAHEI